MKKVFVVANWKSNKTVHQAKEWLDEESRSMNQEARDENKEVIICPSFTLLNFVSSSIKNQGLPLKLGAQGISVFGEGAYTGEVNGKQIKEFAEYVIVGHSERRGNFGETEEVVFQKLDQALAVGLVPIVCISSIEQIQSFDFAQDKSANMIIAYEPLFAVGSGKPDTPEKANEIGEQIKKELGDVAVLYGGSVNGENVRSFTQMKYIDGVLVGGASLNPHEFSQIIQNA